MSKYIRIIVVGLLVAVGGWFLYDRIVSNESPSTVFYGNVDIREVSLGFRVSGRVARLVFHEGDPVEAGQLMAQLDTQPFEDELALRKANVAQQQANLEKLLAGNRPQEIEQARAAVEESEAELENAKHVFARQERLAKGDYASAQALDDAAQRLKRAKAQARSTKEALKLAIEGARNEDIAAAKAVLEAAKAQQQIAETALKDGSLLAPDGGVILTRAVEPGAIVSQGTTVYTLSLRNPVWVRAYVPETQLGLVTPGTRVQIITDTKPDSPYQGQVGFISPTAEFTPKTVQTPELRTDLVYRFRVVVTNPDAALRQGMPVTVRLKDSEVAAAPKQ